MFQSMIVLHCTYKQQCFQRILAEEQGQLVKTVNELMISFC